jgi:hypothetical protein
VKSLRAGSLSPQSAEAARNWCRCSGRAHQSRPGQLEDLGNIHLGRAAILTPSFQFPRRSPWNSG